MDAFPEITEATEPTLDAVRAALERGELKEVRNSYVIEDLVQQLFQLQPLVWRHRALFAEKGWPDVDKQLVQCIRLFELTSEAEATRRGIVSGVAAQGELQRKLRQRLIDNRDAIVRLAREAGLQPRLFSVRFGRGDASNVLPGALSFRALLEKHVSKLGDTPLVREIVEEVEADVEALIAAESSQEVGKKEALLPVDLRVRARHALYANLLTLSRVGFAVFRNDEEMRAHFGLTILQRRKKKEALVDGEVD